MSNHVDEWLDGAERRVCSQPTPTGWDTGLCQDYCRKLSMWFASRLDARHTLRRWFGEQRKGTKGNEMTTHQDTSTERDLVARMRSFEVDHEPDGWPAVRMRDISALCDEIERLRAAPASRDEAAPPPQTPFDTCPTCEALARTVMMDQTGAA